MVPRLNLGGGSILHMVPTLDLNIKLLFKNKKTKTKELYCKYFISLCVGLLCKPSTYQNCIVSILGPICTG